jgi:dCTP deaminase
MLLADWQIQLMCETAKSVRMIHPYHADSINTFENDQKIPSFGQSSFGYDVRLGRNFKVIQPAKSSNAVVDMFKFQEETKQVELNDVDHVVLYPHQLVLGVTIERINLPRNVSAICMAKSTIARMGIEATVTPLEAGWCGYVTIELINKNAFPIRIYSGIGIMQALFLRGEDCRTSYADRGGKYQNQPDRPVSAKL